MIHILSNNKNSSNILGNEDMLHGNLNVANIITIYRILLVPFFIYSYYVIDKGNYHAFLH